MKDHNKRKPLHFNTSYLNSVLPLILDNRMQAIYCSITYQPTRQVDRMLHY